MEIRDPIYGLIPVNEWEIDIINSEPFQRLRNIQQLGLTSYIYPSATHTRFEHSIGTMHLSSLMYDSIINDPESRKLLMEKLSYNEDGLHADRNLIRIAALLHDIGHTPFSHALENIMYKNRAKGKYYDHEDYTRAIIRGPLREVIEKHPLNNNYRIKADEVADLLEGKYLSKLFWKILISSQLDADKGDYLLRDAHHIGVKYGIYDFSRLLNTLSIGRDPETDYLVLCVKEGGLHIAESIIFARYQMFTQVYFHKTRRIYDYHLKKACEKVLNRGKLPKPENIDDYLKYNDQTMWKLIEKNSNMKECDILLKRNHMRMIYESSEDINNEEIKLIKKIENKLKVEKIKYYKDNSYSDWYKIKGDEIQILTKENKVKPLSECSSLIKKFGVMDQTRIYVKKKDRKFANEIIKKLTNN